MDQNFQRLAVVGLILLFSTTAVSAISHRSKNIKDAEFTKTLVAGSRQLQEAKVKTRPSSSPTSIIEHVGSTPVKRSTARKQPAKVVENLPSIYGVLEYSDSRDANNQSVEHTMCKLPTNDDEKFEIIIESVNGIDGATGFNGTYYAAYGTGEDASYKLIMNSWDFPSGTPKGSSIGGPEAEAYDLAYNPADGKVYGFFVDPERLGALQESSCYFGTIDLSTCVTTHIADMTRQMAGIGIDATGKIYALEKVYDKDGYSLNTTGCTLYEIDATSGALTLIGETGLRPHYRTSACVDPQSGRLFFTLSPDDEEGYLYEIDTQNGKSTLIYQFPGYEEVVGLFIPDTGVSTGSPAAVEGLAISFADGGLAGTVSFTMPTTDVDSQTIVGELSYTVTANSTTVANGTAPAGAKVSAPVTLDSEGLYTFAVRVEKDGSISPETTLKVYVGHDTPVTPTVEATLDNNEITVSWAPVTTAVNGGYIDPESVSYTVTRYPGSVVIAENTTSTSVVDVLDNVAGMAYFYYDVTATASGVTSQPGRTEKIIYGSLSTPDCDDFNDINKFDFYTVIDANGDGTVWGPYIGNIRITYSDDASLAMDDWLITPPVKLYAGNAYPFSIDVVTGNGTVEEAFEVKVGRDNTVEAMTTTIIEKQSVAHTSYETYTGYIVPEETGIYYAGVHGCSEPDTYTITIDNLTFGEALDASVPAEPADLTVESFTNGELKANVSVTAPSTTIIGTALTSPLSQLVITRNGEIVKTFEAPASGAKLSFVDNVDACSYHSYAAYAVNDHGEGPAAKVNAFVGVLTPEDVTNVQIFETATAGEVTITWDAPDADEKGNLLNPEFVTYNLYKPNGTQMYCFAEGITETSYTFTANETPEVQKFAQYVVCAATLGGESDGEPTPMIPVGLPYSTPYRESFANGKINGILATNSSGGAVWQLFDETIGIPSADADNGMIGAKGTYIGDYGTLLLGKVDLSGLSKPGLSFYTYVMNSDDNNDISVYVECEGETTLAEKFVINELSTDEGWTRAIVSLDEYKDKVVRFTIMAVGRTYVYTFIDNIRVENLNDHNLAVINFTAPEKVRTGVEFNLTATIENLGMLDAAGYTVDLYCNDVKIDSKAGDPMVSPSTANVEFTATMPVIDAAEMTFKAVIVYSDDEVADDNTSQTITVTPVTPTLPYVETLAAKSTTNGIVLDWEEPNEALYVPDSVTDDFESYTSWAEKNVGDWTFIDLDGSGIGGFNDGTAFPGIHPNTVHSWWVFDHSEPGYNDMYFEAHSGEKFLAQMYGYKNGQGAVCDDWAISPELFGSEQTISLYARAMDSYITETMEILYSTGSTNPDDFVLVNEFTATGDWACYNCPLPEGAKRFAIRCTSDFAYMLFVDDVTYIPAADEIEHTGYNIYRDGQLIETVNSNVNTFTDPDGSPDRTYHITALYGNKGESRPSEGVKASDTGIDNFNADTITIVGGDGIVTVTGAAGKAIAVHTADGRTVQSIASASASETITLSPGIYIVKAATAVRKVIVK